MLNPDDIVKLLLATAFTFAIVVVSWQVARLLSELTANLKEIRFLVRTAQDIVDEVMKDYKSAKGAVSNLLNVSKFPAAVMSILGIWKNFQGKLKRKDSGDETFEQE